MGPKKKQLKDGRSLQTTEKDLELERIYLDQLYDNAQVGIVMAENDGTVIRVNPEFIQIFGYSVEECLGANIDGLIAGPQRRKEADKITRSVAQGEKRAFEALRRCKDGTLKNVLVLASPIVMNGDQVAVYAFYRDITDQRRIETELFKAKQLEATGRLAGGISHDFNNLLSIIMGNLELALMSIPDGNPAIDALTTANDACVKAHDLTFKFLTFSAGGQPYKRRADLKLVVRDVADSVFADHPSLCSLTVPDDLWDVRVDPDLIRHALKAVMENALEAVRENGTVTIRAANISAETHIGDALLQEGRRYVCVAVRDNGIGIPPEALPIVFDPYFSTKASSYSKGLGMGLPVAYSIVTQHGGNIRLDSVYQKGTTAKIFIPVGPEH